MLQLLWLYSRFPSCAEEVRIAFHRDTSYGSLFFRALAVDSSSKPSKHPVIEKDPSVSNDFILFYLVFCRPQNKGDVITNGQVEYFEGAK